MFLLHVKSDNDILDSQTVASAIRTESKHISQYIKIMAETQNIPTFKLVLVGDGGTGKVRIRCPNIIRPFALLTV
jgi:hypothetical protein